MPFVFTLFGLFGGLVLDIYLILSGVKYFSFLIIIIFSIILNILFIVFVFNFILTENKISVYYLCLLLV